MLGKKAPDLVVLGLTEDGVSAGQTLKALAEKDFAGKVLPFRPTRFCRHRRC